MSEFSRRDVLGAAALAGGWALLGSELAQGGQDEIGAAKPEFDGIYRLPALPYAYGDLEPHIDAATLKLHHDEHHAGYVRNANAALAELAEIRSVGGANVARVRESTDKLAYNLSGHLLHSIYWTNMAREGGGDPGEETEIAKMIRRDFGSIEAFRGHFQAAAQQVQGGGWAVLAYEPTARRLLILEVEKHQNSGVCGAAPLLALDVWEHAYYLFYQNKRSSYIKAFMNVVNWPDVDRRLKAAMA